MTYACDNCGKNTEVLWIHDTKQYCRTCIKDLDMDFYKSVEKAHKQLPGIKEREKELSRQLHKPPTYENS